MLTTRDLLDRYKQLITKGEKNNKLSEHEKEEINKLDELLMVRLGLK